MKKLLFVFTVLSALLLQACAKNPIQVTTDTRPLDYSGLSTYRWYAGEDTQHHEGISEIGLARIKTSIDETLSMKQFSESADAPLIVNFSVNAKTQTDINTYQVYDGYAPGFSWNRDYGASWLKTREEFTETEIDSYLEGVLIIDIVDARSNLLVWRGIGKARLPEVMNSAERDKLVKGSVESILENFPPKM